MPPTKILMLGGTEDARKQADVLASQGYKVVYSLAGVTTDPVLPADERVEIHKGGFGGLSGLEAYIKVRNIDCLVDATHPFAVKISNTCAQINSVPVVQLQRPVWQQVAGDSWQNVPDLEAAKSVLGTMKKGTVFLALGAKHIGSFYDTRSHTFVARMVEPPENPLPEHMQLVQQRGPFCVDDEVALFKKYGVGLLVTRNSGAVASYPKIEAARRLGLQVLMIAPPKIETGSKIQQVKASQLVTVLSQMFGTDAE
ncbi:MAG: cobalt-precorrin-6A reductase [Alphaproteobacteria bacterium]